MMTDSMPPIGLPVDIADEDSQEAEEASSPVPEKEVEEEARIEEENDLA
jgi:hypothetical protein